MKNFFCTACDHRVFFDNTKCTHCGAVLAFAPDRDRIVALEPLPDGTHQTLPSDKATARYRLCKNAVDYGSCTWAIPNVDPEPYCRACRLNVTIPNLTQPEAKDAWLRLEAAKRWVLCNLMSIGLPVPTHAEPEGHGLRFSFLTDTAQEKVFTGQCDGLITINIAEADDPLREKMRKQLGETYRTVIGHFRHEIGHYYWDQLIKDTPKLEQYRELFGDEREDYAAAQQRYYAQGGRAQWQKEFVSAYASMHPWEDWAETWAHYLHIVDTLETARACELVVSMKTERGQNAAVEATAADPYDFDSMYRAWVPFTIALNSLNRSMGHPDAYPFVLSERSIVKLRFVHEVVQSCRAAERARTHRPPGTAATAKDPSA